MITLFFERSGILIYPLLLCSVISLAVFIEKLFLLKKIIISSAVFNTIIKSTSFHADDFNYKILTRGKTSLSLDIIENVLTESISSKNNCTILIERLKLSSMERIDLLDLTGRIAPMIGLTGTVIGLARSFQAVSQTGRTGDPVILAGGIWEAMLTTIAGLLIAIPAIIGAHILRHSFRKHIDRLKHCCDTIIYHKQVYGNE